MSALGRIDILIEAINRTAPATDEAVDKLEQMREIRLANQRVTLEETRTMGYLQQVYRAQHTTLFDTIYVMRNLGSIGNTILGMWNSYQLTQLNVKQTTSDLADAQIELATALELYGEKSVIYKAAKEHVADLTDELERMKDQELIRNVGFIMTGAGATAQIILTIATLATKYETVATALGALALLGPIAIPIIITATGLYILGQISEGLRDIVRERGALFGVPPGEFGYYEDKYAGLPSPLETGGGDIAPGLGTVSGGLTVIQTNYGVEGAEDSLDKLGKLIADRVMR